MAAAARRSALARWAITDHDTLEGWASVRDSPGLVCGVEVSACHQAREIHIVGLGIDPAHAALATLLAGNRKIRRARIDAFLARLPADVRRDLTAERVQPAEADSVGRFHLAQALVRGGGIASIREVFAMHLADEHLVDADLPQFPAVAQVCGAIRSAGGLAILAHPGAYRDVQLIDTVLEAGCDGLEAAHPGLDDDLQQTLLALAGHRRLLLSVGSDTHRIGSRRRPGAATLEPHLLAPLVERLG
jgi:predicted metal-dependent phosphoesterase TrpH